MSKQFKKLKLSILCDTPDSWIVPYVKQIVERVKRPHDCCFVTKAADIETGDMLFLLGCTRIVPDDILKRNKHNFVVHESDLPAGRGFSPVSWQVLEGKSEIPIVLFEATKDVDAGAIYLKDAINLEGTELIDEIRAKQAAKTEALVMELLDRWPDITPQEQQGEPTYYRKRLVQDDCLDVHKTIAEQFNHLRIVHNDQYPAWFEYKGRKFILRIYPAERTVNGSTS